MDALVAHYHEIGLKGRNREFFEAAFIQNLRRALRGTGYRRIRSRFGRALVTFKEENRSAEAAERAARVFGIANIGLGIMVAADLEDISQRALELMGAGDFENFSVRARRTYSSFPKRSSEINAHVGRLIQEATGAAVDLRNPQATLYIELFGDGGIVFRDRREGAGGLPVGVSGKLLALLSGGIDSPVAAWRMMRRGAEVELLHFHGQPYTDSSSVNQASDLAGVLTRYNLRTTLHLVPLGDAQREIVTAAPARLRVVLYRRAMLRIAAALAPERSAGALVTGDSLGQVASQTLENIRTVDAAVAAMHVMRPLLGMDKNEITQTAETIGTYGISTRRHQDCCVLFEPRSPATKSDPAEAAAAERGLDIEALVGKALAGIETRVIELPPPDPLPRTGA